MQVDFSNFGALDKAIAQADVDQNGFIDRKEFSTLMTTGFIALEELDRCLALEADPAKDDSQPELAISEVKSPLPVANPGETTLKDVLGMELYEVRMDRTDPWIPTVASQLMRGSIPNGRP